MNVVKVSAGPTLVCKQIYSKGIEKNISFTEQELKPDLSSKLFIIISRYYSVNAVLFTMLAVSSKKEQSPADIISALPMNKSIIRILEVFRKANGSLPFFFVDCYGLEAIESRKYTTNKENCLSRVKSTLIKIFV